MLLVLVLLMHISGSQPGANTINVGGAMDVAYDGIGNGAHSVAGGTVFGDTGGTGITSIFACSTSGSAGTVSADSDGFGGVGAVKSSAGAGVSVELATLVIVEGLGIWMRTIQGALTSAFKNRCC